MLPVLYLSGLLLLCPGAVALLVPRAVLAPQAFQQLPVVVRTRTERVGLSVPLARGRPRAGCDPALGATELGGGAGHTPRPSP